MAESCQFEEEDYEQVAYTQRLKAAVHHTVGQMCDDVGEESGVTFSRQVIAAMSEATMKKCGKTYCKTAKLSTYDTTTSGFGHGKRTVVNADDVKLVARRNRALERHISQMADSLVSEKEKKKSKRVKKATAPSNNSDAENDDSNM
ncbi:centromere protein S-like [Branchiostoma floridae]|uniref:Centromere protein S n=1 Tax=Branchiostoma floridae TaxID=7739 RepID=A0A9J7M8N8_BRAFL|nr:centromere protein S-like [Branchiostoma floridae]